MVITGRRPAPLEETKADLDDLIRHLGLTNRTLVVQGDVGDPKYVGEMFERIGNSFGRIDFLFNRITSYNVCYTKLLRKHPK